MRCREVGRVLAVGVSLLVLGARDGSGEGAEAEKCGWSAEFEAVKAAPGNHKVIFENDRVRVLDVVVPPRTKEPVHGHCRPSVLYVMEGGAYVDYDVDGKVLFDSRKAGPPPALPMVEWLESTPPHAVENLGDDPIHLIRVELKK